VATASNHRSSLDSVDGGSATLPLVFDNRFTAGLAADPSVDNRRRQVTGAAFSRVKPTPVANPQTLCVSSEVCALLGIDLADAMTETFASAFGGNQILEGSDPFAMCYGGHQFGNWAGQLGDGRAIALGEVIDIHGNHQMLQLKGAGPTPYSRTADGRAVLRSSIREFLCSEAMFHLGVPTTRALSLVATGDSVVRDVLYDGHPAAEPGAIVCRVAPSFTRFGNFQLPASRGDIGLLTELVTFTILNDFPAIHHDPSFATFEERVVAWFAEVAKRTALLAVDWMRVGFVHGVLNTDNMSILGLTIDYGPYGWLESFDPDWTPNTTDAGNRRYRYSAQPHVVGWNLAQLANALVQLVNDTAHLQNALDTFGTIYSDAFGEMMAARFGWGSAQDGDVDLINEFFSILTLTETDYVLFCRLLADVPAECETLSNEELVKPLIDAYYKAEELEGEVLSSIAGWLRKFCSRAIEGGLATDIRITTMRALNPRFVLRNWIAQEVIDAAEAGDPSMIATVLEILRHPYNDQPENDYFAARRPEWARSRVGCSMLSCSS
jgi:serine/tyrosine/threonine adenylyltransferase